MTVRLLCRACGKRLKLPDGLTAARSAKCPKCLTPVDLTSAREASAYAPAVAARSTPLLGADDPLPYPAPGPITVSKPAQIPKSAPPSVPPHRAEHGSSPVPPRPPALPSAPRTTAPPLPPKSSDRPDTQHETPNPKHQTPSIEMLSLDDDPPDGAAPAELVPFRVPVWVLADSFPAPVGPGGPGGTGPCTAVLLPHGLFLEHEPMKPFLYVPPGARVDSPAPDELTVVLPDGRSVTFRFAGRSARPLARDARAFLAGEGPVPVEADYRRKWWMLWAALIFALGPLVLAQTVDLGLKFALEVGAGLAGAGFLINAALVIFSHRSIPVQTAVMACGGVLVTGAFLFVAVAYLAGRQEGAEQAKPEQPAPQPPAPPTEPKPPDPLPDRPPSHIDRAKKSGASALEDGSAEVTALALASDGNTLGIGYADGTTRVWKLDAPTFDVMTNGPKADGPVTRVQFDAKGRFLFAHTATGVIAAPLNAPPAAPAKLLGAPVAVSSELAGERIRFAAVRGNVLAPRSIAAAFVQTPPKAEGYALPGRSDETNLFPGKDPNRPRELTFLAWPPGDRFFAGQPDGAISVWTGTGRSESALREHKGAVRAWAECTATGDFATGDDLGFVGVWSLTGAKPKLREVLKTPLTGLSFSPSGARLAITDKTGWLVIWDAVAGRAVHRKKMPTAVQAVAFGPGDDVLSLAAGHTVEVWWLPELVK